MGTIYLVFIGVVIFLCLIKPIYGIYLFTVFFFIEPSQFFPEYDAYRLVLVCSGFLLLGTALRGYNISQLKFVGSAVLLVVIILISLMLSGDVSEDGIALLFQLVKVITFIVITLWCIETREQLLIYIKWVAFLCALNGIYTTYNESLYVFGVLKQELLFRTAGFYEDANIAAGIMAGGLPLAYFIYLSETRKYYKSILLCSIASMIMGVFSTVSRMGLLVLVWVTGRIFSKNMKSFTALFIIALAFMVFLLFAKDLYQQRNTATKTLSGETKYDTSTLGRLALNKAALEVWLRHPLFGVGLNNFSKSATTELGFRTQKSPHNAYLQFLCETGLVGFVCFISILLYSLRTVRRLKSYGGWYGELAGYAHISLTSWYIVLFFLGVAIVVPLWFAIALPFNVENVYQREKALSEKQT